MAKLKFKNDDNELVEMEIKPHRRIEVSDKEGNWYEIRPDKFGGIEVMASDGPIIIEPKVSNQLVLKTVR